MAGFAGRTVDRGTSGGVGSCNRFLVGGAGEAIFVATHPHAITRPVRRHGGPLGILSVRFGYGGWGGQVEGGASKWRDGRDAERNSAADGREE